MHAEKVQSLGIDKPTVRDEKGLHDMISSPDDPFCIVKLYKFFVEVAFPVGYKGRFFRRQAPDKELIKRRKDTRDALAKGNVLKFFEADLTNNGVFGKNYFSVVTKRMAARCGFTDPERHTARSKRRSGISSLASSDVPSAEIEGSARHKSAATNALYQKPNEATHAKRYEAQFYNDDSVRHVLLLSLLFVAVSSMLTHSPSHFYVLQKPAAVPFPSAAPPPRSLPRMRSHRTRSSFSTPKLLRTCRSTPSSPSSTRCSLSSTPSSRSSTRCSPSSTLNTPSSTRRSPSSTRRSRSSTRRSSTRRSRSTTAMTMLRSSLGDWITRLLALWRPFPPSACRFLVQYI
jgi:hypothetical protein